MEEDIVNGISLKDFIKKYGTKNESFFHKIIKICQEDLKKVEHDKSRKK